MDFFAIRRKLTGPQRHKWWLEGMRATRSLSSVHLHTCKHFHSVAQIADAVPQACHPGEGVFLQLIHVVGAATAAPLAVEGTVTVPSVTGQRFLSDCDVRQQKQKRQNQREFTALRQPCTVQSNYSMKWLTRGRSQQVSGARLGCHAAAEKQWRQQVGPW